MTQPSDPQLLTDAQLRQAVAAVAKEYAVVRRNMLLGVIAGFVAVVGASLGTTAKLVLDEAESTARSAAAEVVAGTAADAATRRIEGLEVRSNQVVSAIDGEKTAATRTRSDIDRMRGEAEAIIAGLQQNQGAFTTLIQNSVQQGHVKLALGDPKEIASDANEDSAGARADDKAFAAPSDGLVLIKNGGNDFGDATGGVLISPPKGLTQEGTPIRVRYDLIPKGDGAIGDSHILPVKKGQIIRAWSSRLKTIRIYFISLDVMWVP